MISIEAISSFLVIWFFVSCIYILFKLFLELKPKYQIGDIILYQTDEENGYGTIGAVIKTEVTRRCELFNKYSYDTDFDYYISKDSFVYNDNESTYISENNIVSKYIVK